MFVFYGDCCSGAPGTEYEKNFTRVNAVLRRLNPAPEFIVFLGDHIMGMSDDADALRKQWSYWLNIEMSWNDSEKIPVYHVTSNHDTSNEISEQVWRETFPEIPSNGPENQKGLTYWVRRDDLLLVMVNTSFSGLGGYGHVESEWLDNVLKEHSGARHKIVCGHHPVFPVNGYGERPLWCIVEEEAQKFWSVLVKHKVLAYLCSHIIAFDIQEHDGVLQVCSGGAGTNYGPGGFMGEGEYLHFVQAFLDEREFRIQTIDTDGKIRENLSHPVCLR